MPIKTLLSFLLIVFSSIRVVGQIDVGSLLEAGTKDAEKYMENYISPLLEGFGFAMNGGWYATGKPHELGGFDFTITATAAFVSDKKRSWEFRNKDFSNILLTENETSKIPTILGPNIDPDELDELSLFDTNGDEIIRISPLTGLGLEQSGIPIVQSNAIPSPMVQLGIGLIQQTELKIRWVPNVGTPDVSFGLFGIGFLHELTSDEFRMKEFPIDISLFLSYSRAHAGVTLDESLGQSVQLTVHGTSAQIMASKDFSFLTLYSSAGFGGSFTRFDVLGQFNVGENDSLIDPIGIKTKGISPRMNFGARILYANVSLHLEYVAQEFPLLTAGLGFSFR